jgi:hypothetical protein
MQEKMSDNPEEANDQGTCEPVAKDSHFVASEDTHLKGLLILTPHCSIHILVLAESQDPFLHYFSQFRRYPCFTG